MTEYKIKIKPGKHNLNELVSWVYQVSSYVMEDCYVIARMLMKGENWRPEVFTGDVNNRFCTVEVIDQSCSVDVANESKNAVFLLVNKYRKTMGHGESADVLVLAAPAYMETNPYPAFTTREEAENFLSELDYKDYDIIELELR